MFQPCPNGARVVFITVIAGSRPPAARPVRALPGRKRAARFSPIVILFVFFGFLQPIVSLSSSCGSRGRASALFPVHNQNCDAALLRHEIDGHTSQQHPDCDDGIRNHPVKRQRQDRHVARAERCIQPRRPRGEAAPHLLNLRRLTRFQC